VVLLKKIDFYMLTIEKTTDTKSSLIKQVKVLQVTDAIVYTKFINWVIGEFDLYLMNESKNLKVYFPNGWFSIGIIKNGNNAELIEINVVGKSRIDCQKIMNQLEPIYNQIVCFSILKVDQ
jgi:hypothetical protein